MFFYYTPVLPNYGVNLISVSIKLDSRALTFSSDTPLNSSSTSVTNSRRISGLFTSDLIKGHFGNILINCLASWCSSSVTFYRLITKSSTTPKTVLTLSSFSRLDKIARSAPYFVISLVVWFLPIRLRICILLHRWFNSSSALCLMIFKISPSLFTTFTNNSSMWLWQLS